PTLLQGLDEISGERVDVDFEPHGEGRLGAYAVQTEIRRGDAAERGAFDGFVQTEQVAPESLVAEGVETEGLPALADHELGVFSDLLVVFRELRVGSLIGSGNSLLAYAQSEPDDDSEPDQNRDYQLP